MRIDDYFSYKGSNKNGVRGAFKDWVQKNSISYRLIDNYGMGGVLVVINSLNHE